MPNLALLILCFLLGMLLRRLGRFPEATPSVLNAFIIHVSLPALTLLYVHALPLDRSLAYPAAMAWILFALGFLFFVALGRALDFEKNPHVRKAYEAGVESIRQSIAKGEIYQANLTRRLATPFRGDPWPLYRRLRTGDPALFAAYLELGAFSKHHVGVLAELAPRLRVGAGSSVGRADEDRVAAQRDHEPADAELVEVDDELPGWRLRPQALHQLDDARDHRRGGRRCAVAGGTCLRCAGRGRRVGSGRYACGVSRPVSSSAGGRVAAHR